MKWTIEQRWSHALFLNWKVPSEFLANQVPFPLDLHEGQAVLSLVPFYMDQIRFRGLPAVPAFSRLWEINLRTYVRVNGVPGIFFFTLETPHHLGNFIARSFFHLPYRHARLSANMGDRHYEVRGKGKNNQGDAYLLHLEAEAGAPVEHNPFQKWVTERYHLFLSKRGQTMRGDVHHEPWKVRTAKINQLAGGISILSGFPAIQNLSPCFIGDPLRVRFSPFVRVDLKP
jgi:uncharacterized protein YqjF (DUF2071 family)